MHRRKLTLITAAVVGIPFVALGAGMLMQAAGRALDVTPIRIDFGTLAPGETRRSSFTIRNRGTEPVDVLSVTTSCGCTTPGWREGRLEPGAQQALPVSIKAPAEPGPVNTWITIAYRPATRHKTATKPLVCRLRGTVVRQESDF